MSHQIVSAETISGRDETVAYLERVLEQAVPTVGVAARDGAPVEDAALVYLVCVDASARQCSDELKERAGSAHEMSRAAMACFDNSSGHHISVVMRADDRRFSVKEVADGYRVTISRLPRAAATRGVAIGAGSRAVTSTEAAHPVPRPPGLSSGVRS